MSVGSWFGDQVNEYRESVRAAEEAERERKEQEAHKYRAWLSGFPEEQKEIAANLYWNLSFALNAVIKNRLFAEGQGAYKKQLQILTVPDMSNGEPLLPVSLKNAVRARYDIHEPWLALFIENRRDEIGAGVGDYLNLSIRRTGVELIPPGVARVTVEATA